jgi:hypothetical protein
MGWNLDELGFKPGERVYHVVPATVTDDGEPDYDTYGDLWYTEEEWKALTARPAPRLKTYRIQNRITQRWWQGQAPSAQEACDRAGWPIGSCYIREYTPVVTDPTRQSGHRGGGWKNASLT